MGLGMKTKLVSLGAASITVFIAAGIPWSPMASANDAGALSTTSAPAAPFRFALGRVLVKFKDARPIPNSGVPTRDAPMGLLSLPPAAQASLVNIKGKVERTFANLGVVQVKTGLDTGKAIEALYRSGTVVFAEPDYEVKINKTPNDPSFSSLWGLHNTGQSGGTADADIDAPEAWDTRTDASTTIVGVVDTGVDYTHSDLSANMWKNPGEIAGNGIDDDANGYVDDVYGIDTANDDSNPMDDQGHGTHVSGTVGASGNNSVGVVGVAWKTKIMALKFLSSGGSGYTSDAVELINYTVSIKKKNSYPRMILSNSWGGGGFSDTLYNAIKAAQDAGVLFVAAAGNDGRNTDLSPNYPSDYDLPSIISVGASDYKDLPAYFSNYGCKSVDLFAPGVNVYSTYPGNQYATMSGTSMATPHVSGAAAIVWSQFPTKSWKDVKRALMNGADAKSSLAQLTSTQARLNLKGAITSTYMNQPSIWGLSGAQAAPGATITLSGSNFGATQGAGTVSYQGTTLTVKTWAAEKIVATLPANTPIGSGLLKVKNASGVSNRNGHCFSVSFAPQLVAKTILPHAWAAGAKVGTDSYWILGGATSWGVTGLVEKYTPSAKRSVIDSKWVMPKPVTNAGAAAIGSKIYVVGGLDANYAAVNNLQVFNTATGTWSSGKALPVKLSQPAVVSMPNGKLYVFGGSNEYDTSVKTTYIYTPATNAWSTGASMPTARAFATGIQQGTTNVAWIMGGYSSPYLGYELKTVEVYNASTNSWSTKPSMTNKRAAAAGAYYKSQNHVLNGADYYGRADGEWFQPNAWINGVKGTQALRTPTGAVFDGAYVFGGYDDDAYSYSNNIWRIVRP